MSARAATPTSPATRKAAVAKAARTAPPAKSAAKARSARARKAVLTGEPKVKDMDRWLGDGGMPVIDAIGASFDDYGTEGDDHVGWATALWEPTALACNPHGIVQGGVHSVVLDAAMNFAANAGLSGRDRTKATLEMKTELMRPAAVGERLTVRGAVVRMAQVVAYAEARVEDAEGRLVSRATGTFLIQREA
jgi:uncharacterized protein (TIGR00369 family)